MKFACLNMFLFSYEYPQKTDRALIKSVWERQTGVGLVFAMLELYLEPPRQSSLLHYLVIQTLVTDTTFCWHKYKYKYTLSTNRYWVAYRYE